ncbi:hypothetical protein [Nocardia rhamnosiphila]
MIAVQRFERCHVLRCEPDTVVLDDEADDRLQRAARTTQPEIELSLIAALDGDFQTTAGHICPEASVDRLQPVDYRLQQWQQRMTLGEAGITHPPRE